jgi:quercetin dioxygenase-like cupin family protein
VSGDSAHSHAVAGSAEWLFITIRPTAAKATDPHGGTPIFQSEDLPPPPGGANREALLAVTLAPGGRSGAFKSNGIEMIYVVDGEVEIHSGTTGTQRVTKGHAMYVLQGTPINVYNTQSVPARYLAFFLVPAEQTSLQTEQPAGP